MARLDFEVLGRQAEAMAVRTVAVDDVLIAAHNPQLVILGAGLDGRAWRIADLADVSVFEVDHPASQRDKQRRAAALRPLAGPVQYVSADLAESNLDTLLAAAGHDVTKPTTWILEGVIPYLTAGQAGAALSTLAERSAPRSTVVVTYETGSFRGGIMRTLARGLLVLVGRGDPMKSEPRLSEWSPASVSRLLEEAGFRWDSDDALSALARALDVPDRNVRTSRVATGVLDP